MISNVTGVILAGGQSRRFGSNKALATWGDSTLIETICRTFHSVFDANVIVVKDKMELASIPSRHFPIVEDHFKEQHALGGIVTALKAAKTKHVFIAACDTPLIQPELLQLLCSRHVDSLATIPVWSGQAQPLSAVYSTRALPALCACIDKKQLKLQKAVEALHPNWISDAELRWAGVNGWSFFDLDTQEDYLYARNFFFGADLVTSPPRS